VTLAWSDLPLDLRAKLAQQVGDAIEAAVTVSGGFGRSATFILKTTSRGDYFCKGTYPGDTELGHDALLRERAHYEEFPELAEFGPTYFGAVEHDGWQMLVLNYIRPAVAVPPWSEISLVAALQKLARFHAQTPARAAMMLERAEDFTLFNAFNHPHGWSMLATNRQARDRFAALFADPPVARSWFDAHIRTLEADEAASSAVGGYRSWIHQDLRADNLIFSAPDRVTFVDWPFLAHGPALMDVAFFAPSVEADRGPPPEVTLSLYQRESGWHFNDREMRIASVMVAGFFAARAGEPEIEGLSKLRWVQRMQLFPALAWACRLVGINCPEPRDDQG
jgi:Phosphotransferase enzyme family